MTFLVLAADGSPGSACASCCYWAGNKAKPPLLYTDSSPAFYLFRHFM